jgi:hypothetical protein
MDCLGTLERVKLKWGDIKTRVRGDLTAIPWKDKCNEDVLTIMHTTRGNGNFCERL